MKPILRQAATLALFLLLLYSLALLAALPAMPKPAAGSLDTAAAARSIFMTEPKYAFFSRSRLDTPDDKAILLGASNVLAGFRPPRLQGLVPGATVHNLAIGGANMTEVGQLVDLILEAQGPAARRHNTFVIGLWHGLFADDRARWHTPDRHPGDTDLDIERYRYGFYRRTAAGPVPLLPPSRLDDGIALVAPFLLVDRLARDAGDALGLRRAVAAPAPAPAPAAGKVPDADAQRRYLAFWDDYMGGGGTLTDEAFAALARTVDTILASGGQVLLVDLPLPRWHAQGSPYEVSYRRHWKVWRERIARRAGVVLLSLADADRPEDFSDEVHPRPEVAAGWAERLAAALNALPSPSLHSPPERSSPWSPPSMQPRFTLASRKSSATSSTTTP